jgi:hypothetical protein
MSLTTVNDSTTSEQQQHSPAKIQVYEEPAAPFGAATPGSATKKAAHIRKITLDHSCVDVPSDAMLKDIFNYFDKDGSGAIDLKEFKSVFKDCFDNFGAPMEDRDVDRIFAKFDKGGKGGGIAGDGKLHYDEFAVLMLSRLRM